MMSNTYTQLYIQVVFAVKYRECLIAEEWQDEFYKYIIGIIHTNGHQIIAINGMPDHIHIFFGMKPKQSIADLVQDIKTNSSKWINDKRLTHKKFKWQTGYGAFSYAKSQLSKVAIYIYNQKTHHEVKSMLTEYKEFLNKFEIDYNEAYIFHDPL